MAKLRGVLPAAVAAAVLVSGCSASSDQQAPALMLGHVHNLAIDGDALLFGTHDGLWQQRGSESPVLLSSPPFDVMGLTVQPDNWLASGHPGPAQQAPSNLGLLRSRDSGRTWESVSLYGEVDFHRLAVSARTVIGVTSDDQVLRSQDSGRSWTALTVSGVLDVAIDPEAPASVVAATEAGVVRSSDGGTTFAPVPRSPALVLLSWTADRLYGATADGAVHASSGDYSRWERRGGVTSEPLALAASGDRVTVLSSERIGTSIDGGRVFVDRPQP